MTKSLEYGKCLETGETTKSLEFDRVTHAPSYNYSGLNKLWLAG